MAEGGPEAAVGGRVVPGPMKALLGGSLRGQVSWGAQEG